MSPMSPRRGGQLSPALLSLFTPLRLIWGSLAIFALAILVLACLSSSPVEHQVSDSRWAVDKHQRQVFGWLAAVAAAVQAVTLHSAAGYSSGDKRPPVLAAAVYCTLCAVLFQLDAHGLILHPYGLEIHLYICALGAGAIVYSTVGIVLALHLGEEQALRIWREPLMYRVNLWYFLFPIPRFLVQLSAAPWALPVAATLSAVNLAVFAVLSQGAIDRVTVFLPVHWTVTSSGTLAFIASIAVDAVYLAIAAGTPPLAGYYGLLAFNLHSVVELVQIGITCSQAIMSYEESSRFKLERDSAQAELASRIEQQKQAKEAEEARQKFLRYVFHEIRVPFNSLDLGLGMILDDVAEAGVKSPTPPSNSAGQSRDLPLTLTSDARSTLDIMAKAAASMKVIINDTLDWTKLQSGAFQISLGPTRIEDVVSSTLLGLTNFALHPDNRVKLVQEVDPRLPSWLLADKVRLQQVVANFLSNAIKFAPHDGTGVVTVKVHVLEGRTKHSSAGSILDSGPEPADFHAGDVWWKEPSASVVPKDGPDRTVGDDGSVVHPGALAGPRMRRTGAAFSGQSERGGSVLYSNRDPHRVSFLSRWLSPSRPSPMPSLSGEASAVHAHAAPETAEASQADALANSKFLQDGAQAVEASAATCLWYTLNPSARMDAALPILATPIVPLDLLGKLNGEGFTPVSKDVDAVRRVSLQPAPASAASLGKGVAATLIPIATHLDIDNNNMRTESTVRHAHDSAEGHSQLCTLVITIRDNGEGIQAAEAPTLFRAFKQLDAGMQYKGKGTGLGLAICHEIVSLHGGRVGVRTSGKPGEGAEFVIALRLPVLQRKELNRHFHGPGAVSAWTDAKEDAMWAFKTSELRNTRHDGDVSVSVGPILPSTGRVRDNSIQQDLHAANMLRRATATARAAAASRTANLERYLSSGEYPPRAIPASERSGGSFMVNGSFIAGDGVYPKAASRQNLPELVTHSVTAQMMSVQVPVQITGSIHETHGGQSERSAVSTLPLSVDSAPASAALADSALVPGPQQDSQRKQGTIRNIRVLVVEDVADSRKLLCKSLKRRLEALYSQHVLCAPGDQLQVETFEAEDGYIAVEMVTGMPVAGLPHSGQKPSTAPIPFDVITMDMEMPVMSGFTATQMIRTAGFAGLVFGCTGNALEEDQQLFLTSGANHVFIKPLDIGSIASAIAQQLWRTEDVLVENGEARAERRVQA